MQILRYIENIFIVAQNTACTNLNVEYPI